MRQVLCPRIIGRAEELQAIGAAVDAARGGRGGSIVLLGEAGVGKSRLAREADRLAQSQGMCVLWGRSVEGGAAVAYRPIAEALLSALRRNGLPGDRPELRPFLKILSRLIPEWRDDDPAPVEDSLVLLSEAVLRLLRVMGANAGCLLVLEDLHWADSETLSVFEYLTANATSEPLLILATSRPEPSSAALSLIRSLDAHRIGTVLDLARLSPVAVRAMASACLDDADVPDAVDRLLSASADGLPLLVEDLLAEWVGAGALTRVQGEDRWHVGHVLGTVVPVSFGETVRRRVRVLGEDSTRVLHFAVLLGRQFDWTLLPPASGLDEDRVLELLHAAVDAQLLVAEFSGFRFRHALTRAAVLEELLPAERARQAARLLALVETAHPQLDGGWCELAAELADTAGDRARAATLLLDSGRKSLAHGALTTAEVTLERARALAPVDAELRTQIDEALLHVLSNAGKPERVFEVGEDLLVALARRAAPALRSAHVHLSVARAAVAGARLPEASHHLAEARRLDTDGVLEARLDALAAHVSVDERRTDDAERLAQAALAAAERLDQPEVACEALLVIGRLARAHNLDRAEDAFGRAHSVAEAHGLPIWRGRALHELGTIDMFRDASGRRLLEARTLALESGALVTAAWVDGELAALFNMRFEMDLSLEAAQRAHEAGRRFRLRGVEAMALLFEAEVYAFRQDRAAMERTLAELTRVSGADSYFSMQACECRAIAALLDEDRKLGMRELATEMEFARRMPMAAPSPSFGIWALLRSLENLNGAEARAELRASWAMAHPGNRGFLAYADAIDLGRHGQTVEAAQAVADGDREVALGPWYRHFGRRLVAEVAIQDGWGEPATWLREGQEFFDRCGYHAVASACRSLLRKCGAPSTSGRAHRGVPEPFRGRGVTEREMEVLSILADGLSNKEIGVRLYLSPKTIEKHVASLMDKLEVRTRAQLATIAAGNLGGRSSQSWGKLPI
jgi:DNA-binding CsgD family transcriptional regulator